MTQRPALTEAKPEKYIIDYLNRDAISKILGTVVYDRAFFFYEGVGKPTGDFSISLADFCNKIKTMSTKSLAFHMKREDFQNWIRDVFGDIELSDRIASLKKKKTARTSETAIRKKLHSTVKVRIAELQDKWHQTLTWPESVVA